MNFKNLFLAVLLAVTASCVKVDYAINKIPTNSKGDYAILFSKPQTKAQITSVSGTGYDSFNLFAWNSINDTIMNPYSVEASGEGAYQYEDVDGQELQYFKRVADWYDFIGIIPTTHQTELNNGTVAVKNITSFTVDDKRVEKAVNLTDTLYWSSGLAADSPEEFLTAYKRIEKADYGNIVELPFRHQNALIFLGFSSDKTDTKILDYVPATAGTSTSTPNPQNGELTGTAWGRTSTAVGAVITQEDIDYINGLFTYTGSLTFTYGDGATLTATDNVNGYFQEALGIKDYLISKHPSLASVSDMFMNSFANFYLVHIEKNGNEVCGWFYNKKRGSVSSVSALTYTTVTTPGLPAIEGIRVFSADSTGINNVPADTLYCVHVPHTTIANAKVSASGCEYLDRETSNDVIQFSLPENTTLNATPVWSPTTFYAIPGDTNFNFIVAKISYIYNGVTTYDVRVPIHLPAGGLQAGKYYKYEIHITSSGNGTNDPNEARDEKDEIIIEDNPIIQVKLIESGYTQGDERQFKI